jgi:hypothetical protein
LNILLDDDIDFLLPGHDLPHVYRATLCGPEEISSFDKPPAFFARYRVVTGYSTCPLIMIMWDGTYPDVTIIVQLSRFAHEFYLKIY